MSSLRKGTLEFSSTDSILSGFCRQMLRGAIFLVLEPWAGGPGVELGLLTPEIFLPNFYPPHMDVGPAHSAFLLPPTSLDECSFFISVVVRLPFNLIYDSPE